VSSSLRKENKRSFQKMPAGDDYSDDDGFAPLEGMDAGPRDDDDSSQAAQSWNRNSGPVGVKISSKNAQIRFGRAPRSGRKSPPTSRRKSRDKGPPAEPTYRDDPRTRAPRPVEGKLEEHTAAPHFIIGLNPKVRERAEAWCQDNKGMRGKFPRWKAHKYTIRELDEESQEYIINMEVAPNPQVWIALKVHTKNHEIRTAVLRAIYLTPDNWSRGFDYALAST